MGRFLASIEKRAFKIAQFATSDKEEALDIVQDAMLTLVKNTPTDRSVNGVPCSTEFCTHASWIGIAGHAYVVAGGSG